MLLEVGVAAGLVEEAAEAVLEVAGAAVDSEADLMASPPEGAAVAAGDHQMGLVADHLTEEAGNDSIIRF